MLEVFGYAFAATFGIGLAALILYLLCVVLEWCEDRYGR